MAGSANETGNGGGGRGAVRSDQLMETTGRYVLVLSDEARGNESMISEALHSVAGVASIASTREFHAGALDVGQADAADATLFAELGIAVVQADPGRAASINAAAADDPRIVAVEPERILYAIDQPAALPIDYLRGYRDAVVHLYEQASGAGSEAAEIGAAAEFLDTPQFTWGLQATNVTTSSRRGEGIPLAVLDTGFDLNHPDFAGREVNARSFVPGETAQDGHGHGTHCIGTSCGPVSPSGTRRYGVAAGAAIFAGKVLGNQGSGSDGNILAGIEWAIVNRCRVISMSLGADIRAVSQAYETVGRRALEAGTLIVAAAGNNAKRSFWYPGFVGVPANSPSIMAVGAVDSRLRIADFSARSSRVEGGQVDIAGPGVAVYSSWPMPRRYNTISGTSMATPHVSGIAALWSEATGATGSALWSAVVRAATRLSLPSVDVGAGLVQAPQ